MTSLTNIKNNWTENLRQKLLEVQILKKDMMIVIPYLGILSLPIWTRINLVTKKIVSLSSIFELYARPSAG